MSKTSSESVFAGDARPSSLAWSSASGRMRTNYCHTRPPLQCSPISPQPSASRVAFFSWARTLLRLYMWSRDRRQRRRIGTRGARGRDEVGLRAASKGRRQPSVIGASARRVISHLFRLGNSTVDRFRSRPSFSRTERERLSSIGARGFEPPTPCSQSIPASSRTHFDRGGRSFPGAVRIIPWRARVVTCHPRLALA
jgi:hypothetical protein